jgi:hypothetical protein
MKTIIKRYNISSFWHFTDRSNYESIQKHGLLSLRELERLHIDIPMPSGNDWSHDADRHKGLDAYVHLAFMDDHPMLYGLVQKGRIKGPIWLEIESSVILDTDVLFSDDVSNKSGVEVFDAERAKTEIDFDVLYTFMNWGDPEISQRRQRALKSEILIPRIVPIDKIIGIKNG